MPTLINKMETKTSNGVLSKGWYSVNGTMKLVKVNSFGLTKGTKGYEPFSEVMVSKLLDVMQIEHVHYGLDKASNYPQIKTYDCDWVCICDAIETQSQLIHFASYADIESGGICHDYFTFLLNHENLILPIYKLMAIDAITGNSDRHLNNFDVLWDGQTASMAPIFDNGAALLALISDKDLKSEWGVCGPDKSKSFKQTHTEQIALFRKRFGSIKLTSKSRSVVYNEWYRECRIIFELLPENRVNSICDYLMHRLQEYELMLGGNAIHEINAF